MYLVSIIFVKNNLGYIFSNIFVFNYIIIVNIVLFIRLYLIFYKLYLI